MEEVGDWYVYMPLHITYPLLWKYYNTGYITVTGVAKGGTRAHSSLGGKVINSIIHRVAIQSYLIKWMRYQYVTTGSLKGKSSPELP